MGSGRSRPRTGKKLHSALLFDLSVFRDFYTGDDKLDSLLREACKRFVDSNPQSKQDALEKLWDAWERLKTIEFPLKKEKSIELLIDKASKEPNFRKLIHDEANELTAVGNSFMIRHSEIGKTPISSKIKTDYLFIECFY
jgi:hypothetical protein